MSYIENYGAAPEAWLSWAAEQNRLGMEVPFISEAVKMVKRQHLLTRPPTRAEYALGVFLAVTSVAMQQINFIFPGATNSSEKQCFIKNDPQISLYSLDRDRKIFMATLNLRPHSLDKQTPNYTFSLGKGEHLCGDLGVDFNLNYIQGTYTPKLEWTVVIDRQFQGTFTAPDFDPSKNLHLASIFTKIEGGWSMSSSVTSSVAQSRDQK